MKIYIAGPIRHRPQKNRPAFDAAKQMLIEAGHEAVTPFDLASSSETDANETNVTPELCRRFAVRDVTVIAECDGIYMLDGWERSIGARAEYAVAVWCQLRNISRARVRRALTLLDCASKWATICGFGP